MCDLLILQVHKRKLNTQKHTLPTQAALRIRKREQKLRLIVTWMQQATAFSLVPASSAESLSSRVQPDGVQW